MKAKDVSCYVARKEVFDVTRSSNELGNWLQIVESVVQEEKVCVCFVVVPCRKREASDQQV